MLTNDDVGIEVSGIEQARAAALVSGREVFADNIKFDSPHPLESVFITDESGREVLTIPAVELLPANVR